MLSFEDKQLKKQKLLQQNYIIHFMGHGESRLSPASRLVKKLSTVFH